MIGTHGGEDGLDIGPKHDPGDEDDQGSADGRSSSNTGKVVEGNSCKKAASSGGGDSDGRGGQVVKTQMEPASRVDCRLCRGSIGDAMDDRMVMMQTV